VAVVSNDIVRILDATTVDSGEKSLGPYIISYDKPGVLLTAHCSETDVEVLLVVLKFWGLKHVGHVMFTTPNVVALLPRLPKFALKITIFSTSVTSKEHSLLSAPGFQPKVMGSGHSCRATVLEALLNVNVSTKLPPW
jgi:hypothetical protein